MFIPALVLAAVVASTPCVYEGPSEFEKGSLSFCEYGIFSKIQVAVDNDKGLFDASMHLNDFGKRVFDKSSGKDVVFSEFLHIITDFYNKYGVIATITFRHGGDAVGKCYPDTKRQVAVCTDKVDEKVAEVTK